jgi:hypothetical protein
MAMEAAMNLLTHTRGEEEDLEKRLRDRLAILHEEEGKIKASLDETENRVSDMTKAIERLAEK